MKRFGIWLALLLLATWPVAANGPGYSTTNAATATVATTATVADTTDTSCFVGLWESATGNLGAKTDAGLTYNAATGVLTATGFSGPLTGTVTGHATLDGALASANTWSLGQTITQGASPSIPALTVTQGATPTTYNAAVFSSATGATAPTIAVNAIDGGGGISVSCDTDGAITANKEFIILTNTDVASAGVTTQTVPISVYFTPDTGAAVEAARIEAYKVSDWEGAATERDSGWKFYTTNNGTISSNPMILDNTGALTVPSTITGSYLVAAGSLTAANSIAVGWGAVSGTYGSWIGWEGATGGADASEGELRFTDPTADRTVTIPNESGLVQLNGPGTIVDGDATPDMTGARIWTTSSNTAPTAITDLDNPTVGQIYIIICGNTTNASTIADGGNFALSAAWNPDSVGDNLILYVQADNTYYEISRSNN